MKYIFRGHTVFVYDQRTKEVTQQKIDGIDIPAFDYCTMIQEDYKLLSEFFDKAYRHSTGENIELTDIEVN